MRRHFMEADIDVLETFWRARREAGTTHATLSDPRLTKGRFRCHSTHSPCSMTAPAPSVRARWRWMKHLDRKQRLKLL